VNILLTVLKGQSMNSLDSGLISHSTGTTVGIIDDVIDGTETVCVGLRQ